MRSHASPLPVRVAALSLALASLAGCMTQPTREPSESARPPSTAARPEHTARNDAPAPALAPSAQRGRSPQVVEAAEPEPRDPIADVLASRRRGDFPEVELNPTGFTIMEQVRIDGAARTEYERALSLLRQERYAEGIPVLVGVTQMAPDLTAPYVDLGIAYERSGDLEQARKTLETAALLSPDHPVVHNELGIIHRKNGEFAAARESYEKALTIFPDFHYARRNLAVLCDLYLADLECALQNYTSYLESVGKDSEVEIWIADIRNRLSL